LKVLALSVVVGHRVRAVRIVYHGVINLLAESGLVLAAMRGEMTAPR